MSSKLQTWWHCLKNPPLRFIAFCAPASSSSSSPRSSHFLSSQTTTWFPTAATTTVNNVTHPTNISHILFGLGSSVAMWQKRSSLDEIWWGPNVTRGYVCLDANPNNNNNNNNVSDVISFKVSSDRKRFRYTHSQSEFDIRADPYGILAAHPLSPLLSLHHIDALDPIFPTQTQLESIMSLVEVYRVDPPRILQQSFCYDKRRRWTVSISWGFTVQLYPFLVSANELQTPLRTFKTWRKRENGPFTFSTREVSSDPCEQPITYFLEDVKVHGESGNTSTTYKRFDDRDGKVWNTLNAYERLVGRKGVKAKKCKRADYVDAMEKTERIVVVSAKMDPRYWTQAARRQCSEALRSIWVCI